MKSKEYLEYLIKNCGVRGYDDNRPLEVCKRADVDVILKYTDLLSIESHHKVLEVGSGIGRIIKELHDRYGVKPFGVDPFEAVVLEARKRVSDISEHIAVAAIEQCVFPDEMFQNIVCWGVFDLTSQAVALREMVRMTAVDGRILLTGKGNFFEDSDEEAFLAEAASVRKGIPNHYTDLGQLMDWCLALGLELELRHYFVKRGDMVNDIYVTEPPMRFYEYALILRRARAVSVRSLECPAIADYHSRGFREWNQKRVEGIS